MSRSALDILETPEQIVRGQSPPDGLVQLAGGYAPQSGVDYYGDGSGFNAPVYQAQPLPWEREYNTPLRKFITEVLPNTYFRVEYLSWSIDDVGAQAIGAPTNLIPNPAVANPRELQYQSQAFFGAAGSTNPNLLGTSQTLVVPNTESIGFDRVSGLRATWGIPLTFGRLEFSGFAMAEADSQVLDPAFRGPQGILTLTMDTPQAGQFVLANNFVVNQQFTTTTPGTVLATAQLLQGAGQNLIPNIPAGSLVPASAGFGPPGNPPFTVPPQPIGTQTRPTINTIIFPGGTILPPGALSPVPLIQPPNPPTPPYPGPISPPLPANVAALPLTPIFVQMGLPTGQVFTFDTSYTTIGDANAQQPSQFIGPFFIAAPPTAPGQPARPNPFAPIRTALDNEVFGLPMASMPNVFDPNRTANVAGRSPGADAIIVVPTGSMLFPNVNVLLADEISPGGITLPAGTQLRVNEFGFAAIPLLSNGQVGSTFLLYDSGYSADYHSNVWGTEAKLVLDIGPDHNGMSLKPVVGFRYMSIDEQFRQVGLSTVPTTLQTLNLSQGGTAVIVAEPLRASIIDSKTDNNLYGLQVGTSAEYNHKYFSLGVEPRISLGMNQYRAEVTTSNLRSIFDPQRTTTEESLSFAPVFDLNMYGQVHVTPYFTLHAGYNFTYLFQVTRPVENIYYNNEGNVGATLPGVVVDATTRDMHIQGLTVGGEWRFRDLKFR